MAVARYRLQALGRRLRVAHGRQCHTPAAARRVAGRRGYRGEGQRSAGSRPRAGRRVVQDRLAGGGGGRRARRSFGPRTGSDVQVARAPRQLVVAERRSGRAREATVRVAQEGGDLEKEHARGQAQRPRKVPTGRINTR